MCNNVCAFVCVCVWNSRKLALENLLMFKGFRDHIIIILFHIENHTLQAKLETSRCCGLIFERLSLQSIILVECEARHMVSKPYKTLFSIYPVYLIYLGPCLEATFLELLLFSSTLMLEWMWYGQILMLLGMSHLQTLRLAWMQYLEALIWMEMLVPIHHHGYLHDETKFKKENITIACYAMYFFHTWRSPRVPSKKAQPVGTLLVK